MNAIINLFSIAIEKLGNGFFGKLFVFIGLCLLLPLIQKLVRKATKNTMINRAFGIFGCVVWSAFFAAAGFPVLSAIFAFLTVVSIILMAFNAISNTIATA